MFPTLPAMKQRQKNRCDDMSEDIGKLVRELGEELNRPIVPVRTALDDFMHGKQEPRIPTFEYGVSIPCSGCPEIVEGEAVLVRYRQPSNIMKEMPFIYHSNECADKGVQELMRQGIYARDPCVVKYTSRN